MLNSPKIFPVCLFFLADILKNTCYQESVMKLIEMELTVENPWMSYIMLWNLLIYSSLHYI